MKKILMILVLATLLSGCSDPKRVEVANAIQRESEAQYLATVTAVEIEASKAADKEAIRLETIDERIARQEAIVKWSTGVAIALMIVMAILLSGTGVVAARRVAHKLALWAMTVKVDRVTRTWPVLVDLKTGRLTDLETGERAMLDDIRQLDHRRLIISGQARVTGLLAQSAEKIAKSTKAASPGDFLAAIGQSVPLLSERREGDDDLQ
jgi:uncharacterized protein YceK